MGLKETNAAFIEAAAATRAAATDVLATIAAQIAATRPGATLRVTPVKYEPFCDIDVVGGGPVTPLYELVDDDTVRVADLAGNALYGAIPGEIRAGEHRIITPR